MPPATVVVTASELSVRDPGPVVYVEVLGKRQFARTSNVNGMCRIQIMDNKTLAKMNAALPIEVSWDAVAHAMNTASPILIQCGCQERA